MTDDNHSILDDGKTREFHCVNEEEVKKLMLNPDLTLAQIIDTMIRQGYAVEVKSKSVN